MLPGCLVPFPRASSAAAHLPKTSLACPPTGILISYKTSLFPPSPGSLLPFPSAPFSQDGPVLNAPAHALFCSLRCKSCSPYTEIIAQCCSTGCSLHAMRRPGSRLGMTPWPTINVRLQFTSVFLSLLGAVTSQGWGGLCCAPPDGVAEWVSPRFLLLDMLCLRVSHPGRWGEGDAPPGDCSA